ncbi:RRQRL motif-containing zinc-binding protein [Kribbella sp. NPDC049174]|uniref:RRQRL motif-containing zinc-binding protein n=1 Tax=Kribbella sp. NPDC049174 TaxID=3364112 RepID=UPI0037219C1C
MTGHPSGDRGVEWVQLWDGRRWPGRVRNGLPEFRFGQAPSGLSTRRQLRDRGLSRGGQEPFARLTWKREKRFAWLYVDAKATAKRTPSDKQLAAVNKALAARKVCAECGPVDHYVRTTDQLCGDCHTAGVAPTAGGTAGWRTVQAWQDGATDDDADETGDETTEHDEATAASDRAAAALARTEARLDTDGKTAHDAQRDEQLARWHTDDQAERLAAERADSNYQPAWDERGVA